MNQTSLYIGVEAVKDEAYFRENLAKIMEERERTIVELKKLGFTCTDSKTNFVFAKHKTVPAAELLEMLRKQNIFVRNFASNPRISNYLRITIGTREEMDSLFTAIREYVM